MLNPPITFFQPHPLFHKAGSSGVSLIYRVDHDGLDFTRQSDPILTMTTDDEMANDPTSKCDSLFAPSSNGAGESTKDEGSDHVIHHRLSVSTCRQFAIRPLVVAMAAALRSP